MDSSQTSSIWLAIVRATRPLLSNATQDTQINFTHLSIARPKNRQHFTCKSASSSTTADWPFIQCQDRRIKKGEYPNVFHRHRQYVSIRRGEDSPCSGRRRPCSWRDWWWHKRAESRLKEQTCPIHSTGRSVRITSFISSFLWYFLPVLSWGGIC